MDWLDRMNNAMEYIETNLADHISYDEIAQRACCSTYHFQRMFPFITGVAHTTSTVDVGRIRTADNRCKGY